MHASIGPLITGGYQDASNSLDRVSTMKTEGGSGGHKLDRRIIINVVTFIERG